MPGWNCRGVIGAAYAASCLPLAVVACLLRALSRSCLLSSLPHSSASTPTLELYTALHVVPGLRGVAMHPVEGSPLAVGVLFSTPRVADELTMFDRGAVDAAAAEGCTVVTLRVSYLLPRTWLEGWVSPGRRGTLLPGRCDRVSTGPSGRLSLFSSPVSVLVLQASWRILQAAWRCTPMWMRASSAACAS